MEESKILRQIIQNAETVIIGKRYAIELSLLSLLCGGHVLIEDVPGVGKTSLVSALAHSIGTNFRRVQFTPDVMPSDVTGFSLYNQKKGDFEIKQGQIFSSFVLADEINRATPKTQSALLEAMAERQVTIDGKTFSLPAPFMVLATQNAVEFVGTYPLPEAQMDRFLIRISIGYPTIDDERALLRRFKTADPHKTIRPVTDNNEILRLQTLVREVHVADAIYDYIVRIVTSTRGHPDIELGASPRGSLALFRLAQANAFYAGRTYVIPEDVKPMTVPVLAHRIRLYNEVRMRGISPEKVIWEVVNRVTVPQGDWK